MTAWNEIKHYAADKAAQLIEEIARKGSYAIDAIATRHWLAATADAILTFATGKSLGQWTAVGGSALAAELRATGKPLGEAAREVVSKAIEAPRIWTIIKVWENDIRTELAPTALDKLTAALDSGPAPGASFADWAADTAADLKMTLEDFLVARMGRATY